MPTQDALIAAEGIAALIDGLYIRRALKEDTPDTVSAVCLVEDYLETKLQSRGT
jgi:TetR/AcrR family transcriptional repressor of bet genes